MKYVLLYYRVGVVVFFPDVLKQLTENEDFKKGNYTTKFLETWDFKS